MNATHATDQADFKLLQEGDDRALDRLIARWQRPLHAFAWRYRQNEADASDAVAEAFVRLYQQRGRLRADTKVAAWLFTTLTNLCHNQHRWERRHRTVSLEAVGRDPVSGSLPGEPVPDAGAWPAAAPDHDEALAALARAIDRLPHDWKTVVLLHHYQGWSYREIAAVTGCSERGVETRLYRAREQLRGELLAERSESPAGAVTCLPPRPA